MKTRKIASVLAIGLMAGATLVTSCKKSDDTATLPSIGGYNSSNEVASTNLLAHWTFDGTNNEDISKTASSTAVNASFTTGQKGQALQLNAGYLSYPTIAALSSANAIPSVTISSWVKTANNGSTASSVFALTQAPSAQGDWNQGPLNYYIETGGSAAKKDSLTLHSAFHSYKNGNYTDYGGDNVNAGGGTALPVLGGGKWIHYVMVYDGSSSNIDLYANNVKVSNDTYRYRAVNNAGVGSITLSTPTQSLIGAWPNAATGYAKSATQVWQGLFTGSIDELRIYSKALSTAEIGALFNLESAGR